jgi:hypothetical protein
MAEEMTYQQPSWMKLLFSSKAEIEAADPVDRENYYRFVEGFTADPESCGFSAAAGEALLDDDLRTDMRIAAHNQEG